MPAFVSHSNYSWRPQPPLPESTRGGGGAPFLNVRCFNFFSGDDAGAHRIGRGAIFFIIREECVQETGVVGNVRIYSHSNHSRPPPPPPLNYEEGRGCPVLKVRWFKFLRCLWRGNGPRRRGIPETGGSWDMPAFVSHSNYSWRPRPPLP